MDCRTARLLLEFDRPRAGELPADEAADLEGHLSHCPECEARSAADRQIDQHLGRAIRQVEIPVHLRPHILSRLEAQHGEWYRRWFGHGIRAAAAAAAVALITWGWWQWRATHPPEMNVEAVAEVQNIPDNDPRELEAYFKRLGVTTALPNNLHYDFLTAKGLAELPGHSGKVVPQLVFLRLDQHARAMVYVISAKQFDLKALPQDPQLPDGYTYKLEVWHQEGAAYAYLVFHTGENVDWLKLPERGAV